MTAAGSSSPSTRRCTGAGASSSVAATSVVCVAATAVVRARVRDSAMQPAGVFFMYAVLSFGAAIFIYFYFLESKNLSDKEKKSLYAPKELINVTPSTYKWRKKLKDNGISVYIIRTLFVLIKRTSGSCTGGGLSKLRHALEFGDTR